jgi:hypothetical protein
MAEKDDRIGKTLTVVAPHVGHTVTVGRRADDVGKPKAYHLVCECGAETLCGEYWLDKALERGTLAHGAISQRGDYT